MSNDTKVQAHMALVEEYLRIGAEECVYVTNYKAYPPSMARATERARAKIEASARQLSGQPGFVMVPVDVIERAAESLGSFVSDHGWAQWDMDNMDALDAILAKYNAKFAARPLTAIAPSSTNSLLDKT